MPPRPVPRCLFLAAVCSTLAAPVPAFADRAADDAAWDRLRIREVRPLLLETVLIHQGAAAAALVPAEGKPWKQAAERLQSAIAAKTGVEIPILAPGSISDAFRETRHLVVMGNLLTHPLFARLYGNYFACADAAYTGEGGYELRSIHDPWGTGCNTIVLGAQDASGVEAATARLLALVEERARPGELRLGRLMDLHLTAKGRRAPLEPRLSASEIASRKQAVAGTYARPGTERSAAHQTIQFAMLYHRTGDPGWLELYRDAMRQHIQYYATNEYILQEGPRRYDRDFRDSWAYGMVIAWDLVEEAPGWSDPDRLLYTNHVLRMVWESNLYQGWDRPSSLERWRNFDSITHNHHTWPGLANLFGGWYFSRHYRLPVAKDWLDIAQGMFRSCSRSSKPWEDSAGYQWIPQRHVLQYALASGDRTSIEQGHAAQTGTALLQALDSLGRQPAWGDCGGFTSVSGMPALLCALEYATGDGRYRWAIDWLGVDARDEMEAPYWTNVPPRRPDDLAGLSVTYLPPLHYHLFGLSGHPGIWQKPNLPFPDTFDKLTLRSGWGAEDDYLMLDGTAAGSHGHLDGNAIVAFTAAGAQWLVDAEYIRRLPKYHCAVTVLRDGVSAVMPPSARLDQAIWFGQGALTRTTMPHYNGMTWTRNLVFVPRRYVAVIDELTAEKAGEYSLRCCWRVAGEASLDGTTLRSRQREKGFTLRHLSGQAQELVYQKDFAGLPIHHLYQRQSAPLEPGQTVRFINVFAASPHGPPALEAMRTGEGRGAITSDGTTERFGVGGLEGSAATDALLYRVTPSEAWLAGATRFGSVFSSPAPAAVKLDASGAALSQPLPVPLPGLRPAGITGPSQPLDQPLPLSAAIADHAAPQPAPLPQPASLPAGIKPLALRWRYPDFPIAPQLLRVDAIHSDPPPREGYRPLDRLVDGNSSGSTTSCMFPAGQPVNLTLDLGEPRKVRRVRVRSWEKLDGWQTKGLSLRVSKDGFPKDDLPAGGLPVTGTQAFGTNVNTIRELALEQTVRYLRVTGEPAHPRSVVYLAEIEVFGEIPGQKPKPVALAAADLDGDGRTDAITGTASGHLVALSASGSRLWQADADGAVTALAAGPLTPDAKPSVIFGTDQATLEVLDAAGKRLAQAKPPMYRGLPSRVRTISLGSLDGNASQQIVIGCDSWQYLAYSADLNLLWKTVYYAHEATAGHLADLDGDGLPEVVAGNAYYNLQILDHRGKIIARSGSFGPEQTAVTSGSLRGDGQRAAFLGTDGGAVLAFDAKGNRLWEANAGDRITSLCFDSGGGQRRLFAASESGYVWAFDPAGKPLWKRHLGAPVRRLASDGAALLAASGASVARISFEGPIDAVATLPAAATDLVLAGDQAVVLTAEGEAIAVAAGR